MEESHMKPSELAELLKSSRVPERSTEYWDDFPGRVTIRLRREDRGARQPKPWVRRPALRIAALGVCLVAVCLLFRVAMQFAHNRDSEISAAQMDEAKHYYHELETLFPNQLRAIVFDQKGPHLLLSNEPDVPRSPALFLKICGPKGCETLVTFSGQSIKINGEQMEVLADAQGKVIVMGNNRVWAGGNDSGPIHIQSKALESIM
jgi:hypothetical protein